MQGSHGRFVGRGEKGGLRRGQRGGRHRYLGQEGQKRGGVGERKRPEVGKAQPFKGKAANVHRRGS